MDIRKLLKSGFSIMAALAAMGSTLAQNIRPDAGRIETARSAPDIRSFAEPIVPSRPAVDEITSLPKLESDAEYGEQRILRRVEALEEWRFSLSTDLYWTSNVALSASRETDDIYWRTGLAMEFTPQIAPNVFGSFSLRQAVYLYDEFSILDFTDLEAGAGIAVNLPQLANTLVFARYEFQTLFDDLYGETIFHDHAALIGASKSFTVARGQKINVGALARWSFDTDPEVARRHEYSLFAGYNILLTDKLSAALNYVGSYYDYSEFGRDDFNHAGVLSAAYQLTDWASIRAFVNFIHNDSNFSTQDYEVWLSGGGLMLHLEF